MSENVTEEKGQYVAFIEADAIFTIPADTTSEAREYIDRHIETGHLGPANIRSLEEDNQNTGDTE
jgi:hypothetical protein